MRLHTPPRREAATACPHPGRKCHAKIRPVWEAYWRGGQFPRTDLIHSDSFRSAADGAIEEEGHVLVPGLDGLERLGEAVGHVVVLGDVHGGDVE
eukprot:2073535-Rhodomonas_salina.1